jgi:hypothetical protein
MMRRGTLELENEHGEPIEIDFEAKYTFGKPRVNRKSKAA